jgi:hypothetical protein
LDEVAACFNLKSPGEAHELILAHIDESWAHDGVAKSVRAIVEDIDEAAIPFLARLLAYQRDRARVEPRARRFVSLLLEMDQTAIDWMMTVVQAFVDADADDDSHLYLEVVVQPDNPAVLGVAGVGKVFLHGAEAAESIALLRRHGFVGETRLPQDYRPGEIWGTIWAEDLLFLGQLLLESRPNSTPET